MNYNNKKMFRIAKTDRLEIVDFYDKFVLE